MALCAEKPLFDLYIGQHFAHEMCLIDLRKPLADAVGALIQAKRYGNRHGRLQLAGAATFTQVLQQHIAAQ
ncbi:hypothetical protein D3C79_519220 [compost metagenome]